MGEHEHSVRVCASCGAALEGWADRCARCGSAVDWLIRAGEPSGVAPADLFGTADARLWDLGFGAW